MATYADLFGKKPGSGSSSYVPAGNEGETFLLVQTGEPKLVAQTVEVAGKRLEKWLVQDKTGGKWRVVGADDSFDEDDYEGAFQPDKDIHLPVKVVGKLLANGSKDESFEPYDATWDLGAGDQREKFQDAMLEADVPAAVGTRYKRKLLTNKVKPYKYAISMKAGE